MDIVRQLTGREAEYVVDPTLLLNKEEWMGLSDDTLVPKEPYAIAFAKGVEAYRPPVPGRSHSSRQQRCNGGSGIQNLAAHCFW